MNILSFDIEEWSLEKDYFGDRKERYIEFDRLLEYILQKLNQYQIKATFFCLGKIATDFPHVIKKIESEGHEIGSHSFAHKWVNKMSREEFREDTRQALLSIEDLIGKKVKSFRAPAFSIGDSNKWAFEVLAEFGIENDASIFPGARDFGGFRNFTEQKPCIIEYNDIKINEFPIPLYSLPLLHRQIAYSGGGYFRMLPLSFVENRMKVSNYNMCYFHISDLLKAKTPFGSRQKYEEYYKEAGTLPRRIVRYLKSNIGRSQSLKHLDYLLRSFNFTSIDEFLKTNIIENKIIL